MKEQLINAIADLTKISATRKLDKEEDAMLHGVIYLLRDLAVLETIKESLEKQPA